MDRARLDQPELYLPAHFGALVVLDEVHRAPGLFPVLRGPIDRARREGHGGGLYLLLGSASLDLLRQSGESLAGRVSHLELKPFTTTETAAAGVEATDRLWLRGGFPESFLADGDGRSLRWREVWVSTSGPLRAASTFSSICSWCDGCPPGMRTWASGSSSRPGSTSATVACCMPCWD